MFVANRLARDPRVRFVILSKAKDQLAIEARLRHALTAVQYLNHRCFRSLKITTLNAVIASRRAFDPAMT